MNRPNWLIWPIMAAFLALLFTGWNVSLMSRSQAVIDRLNSELELLDDLSRSREAIDNLTLVHRVDLNTGHRNWSAELTQVVAGLDSSLLHAGPGLDMGQVRALLHTDLNYCDSLHWEVMGGSEDPLRARMSEAVFMLMVKRTRADLEDAVRIVHQQGIGVGTVMLSDQWMEAQLLLLLASLFAVVCAALVGSNGKLLTRSHERSELLAATGEELKRINKELRETMLSKEEKEVMLKEIHHRVKNNLQIVRSLIRFQTDKVRDPVVLELFNECINRVGAMALVHEQTYLSKDLANIDVGNYLNSLVRDLTGAYNIRLKLKMDVDIQVLTLGVDTLTPMGLLINEIISNSFKHAFTGRDSGTIIVHLTGSEESGLDLLVGDDGVGISDRGQWERPKSLGMELIQTLAGQLNATMELRQGPGMVYQLHSEPYAARKTA